jgi:signal transduction histidine kinase
MIRGKVFLVLLTVSLLPLLGVGVLTFQLTRRSVLDQVQASHTQLASASASMVRNYVQSAITKLKSIAQMIRKEEDPRTQTKRLNTLLDPPDLFLEVSYWTMGKKPEVRAQVQQSEYNTVQNSVQNGLANGQKTGNRAWNPMVKQQVATWDLDAPILSCPQNGRCYTAETLEKVGEFPALPISVPAPEGAVLTANVDFRPIDGILTGISGASPRHIELEDTTGTVIARNAGEGGRPGEEFRTVQPVPGTAWTIVIREPLETALAPLRQVKTQLFFGLCFAVGLSSLLSVTFARRMVRPVQALARTAEALGRGDLGARTGIRRDDELGHLAEAFDRMAGALQELDAMKSDFVAHVSHELRTPLTSAKMALANVQEGLTGPETLPRIQEDLDRLIRMVNELLDVARLEAGLRLSKKPANLSQVVRSSVDTLRPIAKVALDVRGTGDTLEIDAARVHEIVVNLVDNALKYAAGRVEVDVQGREVRVTDDGPGVPPEHRERIFEKFSKVETGPKPPGAGLGLSIARKLAQLHGGSLVCLGNTFVLRL